MLDNSEKNFREPARKVALIYLAHPQAGGAATYQSNLSQLAREISAASNIELLEFFPEQKEHLIRKRGAPAILDQTHLYSKGLCQLVHIFFLGLPIAGNLIAVLGFGTTKLERQLKQLGVNLVYFSSPNPLALGVHELPIVTTVWDLGHRDLPTFSEFSSRGRWLAREYYFRKTATQSSKIVTDSIATGRKLERFYGLSPVKWVSLGLLPKLIEPSTNLKIIPNQSYIIYPAQKWRHKNHKVLYSAIQLLRDEGQEVLLVETGSDKGYAAKLKKFSKKLRIDDLVLDLGFVEEADLALLIKNSKGLVMPSLLGPTNLPPLEAIALGVPAVVSDIHEFDGDLMALVGVCPAGSPRDWADAIKKMILGENEASPRVVFDSATAARMLKTILCEKY
jgi:glycosyltransferase involved in cell wall biosynthesis